MQHIRDVRKELSEVFANLKSGDLKAPEATEMINCTGKIIASLKVELEFYSLCKTTPNIPFLSDPDA